MGTFHIIDDEANILTILTNMIDCFGYESVSFTSADAYIEYMNAPSYKKPVAILTDNIMPGTMGYELVDIVRSSMADQRIVIISGTPDGKTTDSVEICFSLNKPFKMDALKMLLDSLEKCNNEPMPCIYTAMCKFGLHHCCPRNRP